MIRFWKSPPAEVPLPAEPERFGPGTTLRHLGSAFTIVFRTFLDLKAVDLAATAMGFRRVNREDVDGQLTVSRFVHDHPAHRLDFEQHRYPAYERRVLLISIPGGVSRATLERFRKSHACLGATFPWRGHVYGEWRTDAPRNPGVSPVFIEVRQDYFEGMPLVLRITCHQVVRRKTNVLEQAND